ncbi:vegetative cell wall protein gp1-like [Neltuma alba]|uniref:vegetative cell wall protein gp1-like n=1 Tax=Neltuma alba TaxID=207710 RepID=UPI0010A3312F|nr:vegetative cell wall protein gp1-like [Prosopis alba]
MSWFLVVLILNLTFSGLSEAGHDKNLLTPFVVGTVYCDTCFQHDFSRNSHFIAGASVAVECENGDSKPRFWKEVRTNEHGEFRVELPFSVSKHVKRIKGCTVKLMKSSEPHCSVASAATSSSLSLKSRNQREHTFSAGFFSFKPLQQPDRCNHNPSSGQNSKEFNSVKTGFPPNLLPPPLQNPTTPIGLPNLPPLPVVPELPPLPLLPPLPPVIGIPLPPIPKNDQETKKAQSSDEKVAHPDFLFPPILPPLIPPILPPLIPNPLQPPPLIPNPLQPPPLIPNPFQPPPLIPNPFQPPRPPLIPNPFQPPSPPPLIPNPFQPPPASPAPLIPNPFQPPPASPAPLIPNPFQPPPASPAPLIPNPFKPPPSSPSPLLPIPPIPGLTPSPPPPPPPAPVFPFPFPPLFPPPSPGNPPSSSQTTTP